ncbi:hypothetical protein ELY17_06620 [Corynebacterium sp. SY003]|uniref:hypothetical protein n=1 Tax=unclassified Corynebacterium TaxID=2624378 RepID=UPI001184F0DB|nr:MULTISPECIES: hypothetical protein [unclassified Corynebacterium]TSD91159.1 hypothetical protein ELY17_06620 [Corynebacterium sp. SY003]
MCGAGRSEFLPEFLFELLCPVPDNLGDGRADPQNSCAMPETMRARVIDFLSIPLSNSILSGTNNAASAAQG